MVEDLKMVALHTWKVVNVRGVYQVATGVAINLTVLYDGRIRYQICLGFRPKIAVPNCIDISPQDFEVFEELVDKLKEIHKQISS